MIISLEIMFNGIIEEVGTVEIIKISSGKEFTVKASFCGALSIGESVAVNGVCTTVIDKNEKNFRFYASEQTLSITNLSLVQEGDLVNLERSLIYGSRLSGHIVYGHVDKTLKLIDIKKNDESWLLFFKINIEDQGLVIPKGSVTLNGISLTIFDLQSNHLTVMIIPHTFHNTNISTLKIQDTVNCEFDPLGKFFKKHVESYLQKKSL